MSINAKGRSNKLNSPKMFGSFNPLDPRGSTKTGKKWMSKKGAQKSVSNRGCWGSACHWTLEWTADRWKCPVRKHF